MPHNRMMSYELLVSTVTLINWWYLKFNYYFLLLPHQKIPVPFLAKAREKQGSY